ncbi:MAG: sulfotransferase [Caulobacter sp.]|nr:sulfotransferase [Caulobacter sp.]
MTVRTDPRMAAARQLYRQGRFHEAHGQCLAILKNDPRDAAPYALLGRIAADHRTFDKGADLFQRAWTLDPANAAHGADLARCLLGLNREQPALAAAVAALALGPRDADCFDTLGVVFSRLGQQARAAQCFGGANRLAPTHPGYLLNLGWAEQYLGDFEAAERAWRACIRLDPDNERAILALVNLVPQTPERHFADQLRKLFDRASGDPDRRLRIGHALAKTFEDQGEPVLALDWLLRGKTARAAAVTGLTAWQDGLFAGAAATAPRPAGAAPGDPSGAPIFVFGLPRSGTTLVERIISSHPAVVSAGEPMDFPLTARRLAGAPTRELMDGPTLRAARDADMAVLGADYLAAVRARAPGEGRFTDKLPLNVLYAGLINAALPNARMVCLRRHPIDSCLAIFRQMFSTGFAYYDWTFGLETTARFYLAFDALVAHWRETLPPDRFIEVAYEDVVADQEGQSRALLAWLDLPWDEAVLAFHENAAPVATASAVQVRSPIHAGSVGRWKQYGDRLGPMIDILVAGGVVTAEEVEAG